MDKAINFTDDLSIQVQRYYGRFRISVMVAAILLAIAIGVAYYFVSQARTQVLSTTSAELVLKQDLFDRKLKAWCDNVENFALNISRASLVQLSASYYAQLTPEEREAVRSMTDLEDEDKAIIRYLMDMFASYTESHSISDALIVMADGDVLLGAHEHTQFTDSWREILSNVIKEKSVQYGAFHTDNGKVLVDVGVPIFPAVEEEQGDPLGALIMSLPMNSLFLDLLMPPTDSRGIQKVAFVQIARTKDSINRMSIERTGSDIYLREYRHVGHSQPLVHELDEKQVWKDGPKSYYVMFYESKEKLHGFVAALVPDDYIEQSVLTLKFVVAALFAAVVAFLSLFLVASSYLRDYYVVGLVNRRISEQKAILDSINSTIRDGMALLSQNGSVIYMNEHFFSAGGQAHWVNMHLSEVMDREGADKVLACMREVMQTRREGSVEILVEEQGVRRLYRATVYPGEEGGELAPGVSTGCVVFFRDITEFRKQARESQQRVQTILNVFSTIVESVDAGLRGHTERVLTIIESLGPLLHFSREEQDTLNIAARLFQVGKLFVPRHLLNKRGKLTPEEYAQVCKAPEAAYELLYSLNFGLPVAETVYEMGERVDGRGPRGLKGDEILFTARVLSVVNAFCSMVSPRSYREPLSVEEALEQLRQDTGFDREVVDAMCTISVKDFQDILRRCTGESDSFRNAMNLWQNSSQESRADDAGAKDKSERG